MSRRTLIVLGVVFAVAVSAAAFFLLRGRTRGEGRNPLGGVSAERISRIVLTSAEGETTLVRDKARWEVAAPYQDWADPEAAGRVVETLREFAVGSVVSENPDRYDQFEIGTGTATRVQVFLDDNERASLDAFVGKPVAGVRTAYFRFADAKPVHLARNLMPWALTKDPASFRLTKVIPISSTMATSVQIQHGGQTLELIRSGDVWLRGGSDKVPSPEEVNGLLEGINAWYAADFPPTGSVESAGLETPYVVLRVNTNEEAAIVRIGEPGLPGPEGEPTRYARIDGRDTVFTVRSAAIDELIASFNKILEGNT